MIVDHAVHLFERWVAARVLRWRGEEVCLTGKGRQFFIDRGIEIDALERNKRPLCRTMQRRRRDFSWRETE